MNTVDVGAYGVMDFCKAHDISKSAYYQLRREGNGPREFKVGRRTLISVEAAAEWRRKMEKQAA